MVDYIWIYNARKMSPAAGMVYDSLELEDATIYICGFFAMGGFGLAIFSYYVFAGMEAAPQMEEEIFLPDWLITNHVI